MLDRFQSKKSCRLVVSPENSRLLYSNKVTADFEGEGEEEVSELDGGRGGDVACLLTCMGISNYAMICPQRLNLGEKSYLQDVIDPTSSRIGLEEKEDGVFTPVAVVMHMRVFFCMDQRHECRAGAPT